MTLFSAMMQLHPGGIVAWLVVGLVAGWLAGKVMSGAGYGLVFDLILGLVGAFVGGLLFGLLSGRDTDVGSGTGFWGSLGVAFVGACLLLVCVRFLGFGRRT